MSCLQRVILFTTSVHSSRMHTIHSSSRLLGGWVSVLVHAGIHPLRLGLDNPLGLGLDTRKVWTPPGRPPNLLLGSGPRHSPARPPNLPPEHGLGHPPWTKFLTHDCKNITFPQLRLRTVKRLLCMENRKAFSVLESHGFLNRQEKSAKIAQNTGKVREFQTNVIYYLVIFK